MTTVKHSREKVAEAVGAVLDALKRPMAGQLVTAEETGVDSEFLLDLYMTGHLWIARREDGIVFGVTRQGREVWTDVECEKRTSGAAPREKS